MVVENQTFQSISEPIYKAKNHTYELQAMYGECVFKFTSLSRFIRFPSFASFDGNW